MEKHIVEIEWKERIEKIEAYTEETRSIIVGLVETMKLLEENSIGFREAIVNLQKTQKIVKDALFGLGEILAGKERVKNE